MYDNVAVFTMDDRLFSKPVLWVQLEMLLDPSSPIEGCDEMDSATPLRPPVFSILYVNLLTKEASIEEPSLVFNWKSSVINMV
jgi:hypothetical protein